MTTAIMHRNTNLEAIRAGAALYVVCYHLLSFGYRESAVALLGERVVLQFAYGREAVLAFFVLSGIVNRLSVSRSNYSKLAFLASRARRLLPLYLISLVISILVQLSLGWPVLVSDVLAHLALMQSHFGDTVMVLRANEPLWTMPPEAYFYALAAVFVVHKQSPLNVTWLLLGTLCLIVDEALSCTGVVKHFLWLTSWSLIWYGGYLIPEIFGVIRCNVASAAFLLGFIAAINQLGFAGHQPLQMYLGAAAVMPVVAVAAGCGRVGWTRQHAILPTVFVGTLLTYAIASDLDLGVKTIVGFLARPVFLAVFACIFGVVWARLRVRLEPIILALGRVSFAVYLVHHPVLQIFQSRSVPFEMALVAVPITVGVAAWLLEWVVGPKVADCFRKR